MKSIHASIRLLALVLSLLVLLSSTGLSVDMHFCKGKLRSLNLIGDAKSCVEKARGCKKHDNKVVRKHCPIGCCSDKTVEVDAEDQVFHQETQTALDEQGAIVVATSIYTEKTAILNEYCPSPEVYKPPKIIRNIYDIIQSFLL